MEEIKNGAAFALGASGACPTVTSGDRTWTVGWPTQKAKTELEGLVVEVAIDNIERLKKYLSPTKYEQKCADVDRQIDAAQYLTGGALWRTHVAGRDGGALFLCALLREHHQDATLADARLLMSTEPRQVRHALARVVPPFFTLLVDAMPLTPDEKADMLVRAGPIIEALTGAMPSDSPSPTP